MRKALMIAMGLIALAGLANATEMLNNPGFEMHDGNVYSSNVDYWITAAWAPHAWHGAPNPDGLPLGDAFAFINADPADHRQYSQQNTDYVFEPGSLLYKGVAMWGGGSPGRIKFSIGYNEFDWDNNSFVALSAAEYDLTGDWKQYAGTSLTVPAGASYLGKTISVRWNAVEMGGADDIWVDNMSLTPEPAALGLLALGLLIRRR